MKKLNVIIIFFLCFTGYLIAEEPAFVPERFSVFKTTTLTADEGLSAPCVYDWNNDGKKDLVLSSGSGEIFVYINVGSDNDPKFDSGTQILFKGSPLVIPCSYTTLYGYISPTSDLNGDGRNDLIVGVYNKLYFYKNTGTISSPLFNTDRKQIKLLNSMGVLPSELENDVGAFELATPGVQGTVGAYPITFDFTGDGTIDILSAYTYVDPIGQFHHCAVVYTNLGTTTAWNFEGEPMIAHITNSLKLPGIDITNGVFTSEFINLHHWYVFPCYWDGDPIPDLVGTYYTAAEDDRLDSTLKNIENIGAERTKLIWMKGYTNGSVYSLTNQGDILTDKGKNPSLPIQNPLFVTDWDGDSTPDILMGNILGYVTVFEKEADDIVSMADDYKQNIQLNSDNNNLCGWSSIVINVVDWNDDGNYDILFGNVLSRCFYVLNEGSNKDPIFRFIRPVTIGTGIKERIPVRSIMAMPDYFDWNGDGKKDFIFGGGRSEEFVVFTNINNNKNPVFSTNVNVIQGGGDDILTSGGYSVCTPVDWDHDGNMDLITIGGDGTFVKYLSYSNNLQGLGEGNALRYENGEIISLGYISSKPYFVDWDGDGDDDMIGAAQGKIFIFINEGDNQNKKFTGKRELQYAGETFSADLYAHISVLDFDGDGYFDIIKGTPFGNIEIYYGGPARFVGEDETLMPEDRVILFPNPVKKLFINKDFSERYYINEVQDINDTANIGFAIRDDAVVEIYIYTLSGKLIEKIYGDAKYNYKNIALFNFKGLANGVYIVRIKAISKLNQEEDVVTKKISILR